VAFTPPQADAVKAALARYLHACPVCRTNRWQLNPDVYFLPIAEPIGINIGTGQPCVSAICYTCGSVQLFNIFSIGLAETLGFKKPDSNG
jgi:hypothetical protein